MNCRKIIYESSKPKIVINALFEVRGVSGRLRYLRTSVCFKMAKSHEVRFSILARQHPEIVNNAVTLEDRLINFNAKGAQDALALVGRLRPPAPFPSSEVAVRNGLRREPSEGGSKILPLCVRSLVGH